MFENMALSLPYRNVWSIKSNWDNYPFEVLCSFYWPARNAERHAALSERNQG